MSTHPHSEPDLDRTDELPRLDVEAYEAQLAAERDDTLASTDTWAVQNLREAEEQKPRDTATLRFPRPRPATPEPPKTSDVTLNATHILERIQQLESELASTKEREGALQARVAHMTGELAAKEKEARASSADNARLAEQRSLVVERVQALERQLQDEAARFERDLAAERDRHANEQSAATKARLALEAQVAELSALAVQLREANSRLDDETKAAAKLAKTHIELIEQFKQRVAGEEKNSAQLARHLAAKIAEDATANQELARRDAKIAALTAARDDMAALLDARDEQLQQLEADAQQGVAARGALSAATDELHRTRDELAALGRELDEVRASLALRETQLAERDQALQAAQDAVAELRQTTAGLEQELEDGRRRLEELETREREREAAELASTAELAAARRQLSQQLTEVQSMEQAIRARDTLAERLRLELQVAQDERAIIAGQLEKSRARNKSMAREIFARDSEIASLKADLAVHAETLAAIRQDVSRAATSLEDEHPDRVLEPVGHDGDVIVLDKKMMTIGRTSDNDICIPSKLVSRNHARLLIGPNAVIIEDAGSTNGCLVNDVLVKQQLMREGDVLAIGDLKYRLRTRADTATRTRDNVIPFADERYVE